MFCGSARAAANVPLSDFGQQKHQVPTLFLQGDFKSHTHTQQPGFFSAEKRPGARPQTASTPSLRPFYTSAPPAGDFFFPSRATMAAVTSPETSPQPRVYFQTPAGTTEEPETPVRKQGRVTVKYDRKELRKRLNLEEWIIDQLTDLYDCEVRQ